MEIKWISGNTKSGKQHAYKDKKGVTTSLCGKSIIWVRKLDELRSESEGDNVCVSCAQFLYLIERKEVKP